MKKTLSLFLAAILSMACFTGCDISDDISSSKSKSSESESSETVSNTVEENTDIVNPAGEFPITDEVTTLEVMIEQQAIVADLNDHTVVKHIEDTLNIKLDMTIAAQSAWKEKQNLALSTGTYPEVIMSAQFNNADILKLGVQDKILVPINDEIEKYGVEIKKLWEQQEYLQSDMTAPDGNIYAIPQPQYADQNLVHRKLWVNEQWMENLGIEEDPKTTEEFKAMLMAFKNDDPNGNGMADEIPLSGAIKTWAVEPQWWLMNAFVECEPTNSYSYIEEGKLVFAPTTEAWQDGLRYIAELYEAGLIDPASFTQQLPQLQQLARNPEIDILGTYTGGHLSMGVDRYSPDGRGMYWRALSLVSSPGYEAVGPVKNVERKEGGRYAITDKCENVDVAVRFADWLLSSDGRLVSEDGVLQEGTIRDAKEGELNMRGEQATYYKLNVEEKTELGLKDETNLRESSWSGTTIFNDSGDMKALFVSEMDTTKSTGYHYFLNQQFDLYYKDHMSPRVQIPPVWIEGDDMEKYSSLTQPLFDYIESATAEFITGKRSIDDWDTYLAELDNLGFQDWFRIYSTAVEERIAQ